MLANGSDWSSLVRTVSHGWGPSGRRGCSFMTLSFVLEDGGGVSFPRKREPILCDLADTRMGPGLRRDDAHSVQLPMVTRPPAFSTASPASLMLATCSTLGFLAASMSPLETLFSIDHAVRLGSKPSFTDQAQFLVSTSIAYSTASLGFCVASITIGTTLSFSRYIARLASIMAAMVSRSRSRSRAIQSVEAP